MFSYYRVRGLYFLSVVIAATIQLIATIYTAIILMLWQLYSYYEVTMTTIQLIATIYTAIILMLWQLYSYYEVTMIITVTITLYSETFEIIHTCGVIT